MPTILLIAFWALVFAGMTWLVRQRFALAKARTEQTRSAEALNGAGRTSSNSTPRRQSFDDAFDATEPSVRAALLEQGSSLPREHEPAQAPPLASAMVEATTADPIVIDRPVPPLPSGVVETMAEALAGIVLPCDLAPLTGTILSLSCRDRVTFWTDTHDVFEVRNHVLAELRHLGCSVVDFNDVTKHVHRGSATFEMRIVDDAAKSTIGNDKMYATAPPDTVVVDFLLR